MSQQRGTQSRAKPHQFVADPDVPPDVKGRGACATCHCMGEADDAHHTLPVVPEMEEHRRRAGESAGAE